MICPNCQSNNKEGAKFCNECGFPLTGRIASVTAASSASDDTVRDEMTSALSAHDKGDSSVPEAPDQETDSSSLEVIVESEVDQVKEPAKPFASGSLDLPEISPQVVKQTSGSLDPSSLPLIGLAGVDVDEDGNAFDFGDIENISDVATDLDEENDLPIELSQQPDTVSNASSDFSGLDECLVDAGYVAPKAAWGSGDTMQMPRVDGAAAPKQKEFVAPDPHDKKRGKGRIVAVIAVLLVVALGVAAGVSYQMEIWGGKIIPDVSGMTQADAIYMLEGKGFAVRAEQSKSDETEGLVLLMDPSAGSRTENGSEIVIHVAIPRTVPDVVGKLKDEATSLLAQEGFNHISFVEEKSNEPEGLVLAITPEPGSKAKISVAISVTVAKPYVVPDVAGMGYKDAIVQLEAEGYVGNIIYSYSESAAEGYVLATDPVPGTVLASGSTVTLEVSKSRASELVALAQSFLGGGTTVNIGGTSYAISSVDAVSYLGNNQTSFTVTAAAVTTLDGETVYGSAKQKSGVIAWDNANKIVSIA